MSKPCPTCGQALQSDLELIYSLNVSSRASNICIEYGVKTLDDLYKMLLPEDDDARIKNLGFRTRIELLEAYIRYNKQKDDSSI